jgi:hypothetical protein
MRAPDLRRANWEWEFGGGRRELGGAYALPMRGRLAGWLSSRFFIFFSRCKKVIKGVAKGGCKLEFLNGVSFLVFLSIFWRAKKIRVVLCFKF